MRRRPLTYLAEAKFQEPSNLRKLLSALSEWDRGMLVSVLQRLSREGKGLLEPGAKATLRHLGSSPPWQIKNLDALANQLNALHLALTIDKSSVAKESLNRLKNALLGKLGGQHEAFEKFADFDKLNVVQRDAICQVFQRGGKMTTGSIRLNLQTIQALQSRGWVQLRAGMVHLTQQAIDVAKKRCR